MAPALTSAALDGVERRALRQRNQQRGAVEGAVRHGDEIGTRPTAPARPRAPAGDAHAPHRDFGRHGVGGDAREHEHRQGGRMVGALDEGQPRDDLGRGVEFERAPPRAGAGDGERRHQAEIAFRFGHRLRPRRPRPYARTNGTVKPKWKRAESRISASPADRSACTENGACTKVKVEMMTRQMLSTVSSGRMPLWRSTSRRIISASRAGRNAEPVSCVLLGRDQPVDDLAALHQQAVHRLVDAVDLLAQFGERGRFR